MTNHVRPNFDSEELTSDLQSGDPERVLRALKTIDTMRRHWIHCVPLPLPAPDCLLAFGDIVPAEVLAQYLDVVENYPNYQPRPSMDKILETLVEAVIRYGRDEQCAYTVALALRIEDFPEIAVPDALWYLGKRGLRSPNEILAGVRLFNHLLESDTTRKATVEVLRFSAMTGELGEIIEAVWHRLNDEERALIELDRDDY